MKRRFLALLLATAMVASVTGCGGSSQTATTAKAAATTAAKAGTTASASKAAATTAKAAQTTAKAAAATTAAAKAAGNYPNQNITWLVPYTAGGSSDQMARLIAKYSKKYLGTDIVIENVGGGGGNVGLSQFVTKRNVNDGYNITCFNTTANLQPIYGTIQYDWLKELTPLALCVSIPIAIAVPGNSKFNTIEDLVKYAKENPEKLQYGHAGIGSITNVAGEEFCLKAGIKMTAVPFGSGADVLTALMGSQIDIDVASLSEVLSYHKGGQVKILALCTNAKVAGLTDVPTLVSKGYDVDEKVTQGIATAKNTDAAKVAVLDAGFGKIINDPDFKKELEAYGMDVDYKNAADFASFLQKQRETFTKVVTDSGILEQVKNQKK
jgi:tripartite-type tricarboxylate transporter receptor subunit TctC